MLTNILSVLVNNLFYENFDIIFMENKKIVKILIIFSFFIKIFFN